MSEPASNPAAATAAPVDPAAATSFPTATISLPLGLGVLRTYSGVLICIEIVSDCLQAVVLFYIYSHPYY